MPLSTKPSFHRRHFECPHCSVLAQQKWFNRESACDAINQIINHGYLDYRTRVDSYSQERISPFVDYLFREQTSSFREYVPDEFSVCTCSSCHEPSVWINKTLVYPRSSNIATPNADMEQSIQDLYFEAATIVKDSPKGAAALLRLALQKLLIQIGKPGDRIDDDIRSLVAAGLNPTIQKALDTLRVVGNNAVHPGHINFDDGEMIATKLFEVLNLIASELITKPKEIDDLYSNLVPDTTRNAIAKKDGK